MGRAPANHRLAERELIAIVREGEWEIDADGSIWRVCVRHGGRHGVRLIPCKRRRALDRQGLRLHCGEMTAEEARAAIGFIKRGIRALAQPTEGME